MKILTVSGIVLTALVSGCGGSDSSSSAASPAATNSSAASASATPSVDGVPFSSPEWHFSMNFPSEPKQIPLNQAVEGTTINGRLFTTDSTALSVVQFPEGQSINVDGALRGAITGGASTTHGTIVEQHEETFQGRKARQGTVRTAQGDIFVEAVIDGKRLYGITGAPRESFDNAKASFRFLP